MNKNKFYWKLSASIIGLGLGLCIVYAMNKASVVETPQEILTSREVALSCTTDMATEYHIHVELKIFINGQEVETPENLGIRPTCMNAIHAHNKKNILHVESPVKMDFSLGDFFAVWGKDFSSTKLLDSVVTDQSEIKVTVNGLPVDTFENTILKDHDKIVISFETKS